MVGVGVVGIEQLARFVEGDVDVGAGFGVEGMAEHFLEVFDINSGLEHVGGEGVAKSHGGGLLG